MKNKQKTNGFTLIELMLYLAIVSSILFAASQFLIMTYQAKTKNQSISEVENQLQQVLLRIQNHLQNANEILNFQSGLTTNNISFSVYGDTENHVYFLNNQSIFYQYGSQPPIQLTNQRIEVRNLEFLMLNTDPQSLRITITAKHFNPSNRTEFNYTQTYNATITLHTN